MTPATEATPTRLQDDVLGITLLPKLTDKQLEVLRLIFELVKADRVYPTQRQLAERMGTKQASAMGHVNALMKKGYLVRDAAESRRNIRLTSVAIEKLEGGKQLPLI